MLSRQELAEAVNAHLYETTGRVYRLNDKYVGNLERGAIRWPTAPYRAGFRAVLDATDAELGLYINRQSPSDREHAERHSVPADRLPGQVLVGSRLPAEAGGPLAVAESVRVHMVMGAGAAVTVACAENGSAYVAVVAGSVRVVVESAALDAAPARDHLVAAGGAQVYALTREPDGRPVRARVVA